MLRFSRCIRTISIHSGGMIAEMSGSAPTFAVGAMHATSSPCSVAPQSHTPHSASSQLVSLSHLTAAACGMSLAAAAIPQHLLDGSGGGTCRRIHTSSGSAAPSQDEVQVSNPLSPPSAAGSNPLSSVQPPPGAPSVREAVAHLRYIRISPKKLNDFVRLIRKLHVNEALIQSSISVKKAAALVHKCITSARANAINNFKLNPDLLYIDTAIVGSGKHEKRIDIKARGKRGLRKKYRAHMTVKVRELDGDEAKGRPRYTKMHSPYLQRGKYKRGTRPASPEEPFVPYFP